MTAIDPKTRWRQHLAGTKNESGNVLRVAIGGSVTAEPLEPYLGAHLLDKGFSPVVTIAPFGQVHRLCLDHESVLEGEKPDAIAVIWRLEDLFPAALAKTLDDPAALQELMQGVQTLADAVAHLRKSFAGTIVVSVPPYPAMPGFEVQELTQYGAGMAAHAAACALWEGEMRKLEHVRLLDLHGLMLHRGAAQAQDARKWYLYRQPYAEVFWQDIGRQLGRIIAAEKTSAKKCVVLDLDNTLWGGIIGEDGLEGIQLGQDFPGSAFRDFQKYLLHLKSKGVLLAVASKNNPEDAYEVFDKHDAMILTKRDISVFEIHWESKVESLRRIAAHINIGLDALVFVDDNPKEIGEVRERLPDVTCLMVPEELAELPGLLAATDFFDIPVVTEEDRQRTEMIAAETARKQVQGDVLSEEDFRKALELKIDVFRAQRQHLARITQLINKSNQFNLTTRRRTLAEVEALCGNDNALVLGMDIRDKYGDYGLVGVCIVQKDGGACDIDTLLMSCRVLGRGAEETFIAQIAAAARQMGAETLRGKYIPTPKNAMVKDLYARFGFTHDAAGDTWTIRAEDVQPPPAHIAASLALDDNANRKG